MACIDQAPATAEYKLVQLCWCLSGVALKAIKNLGHSAAAYQIAKERLEIPFGGQPQHIAIFLEELENLRPVRFGNFRDSEQFADILDITIINLKENGNCGELGDGSLYLRVQKKLPETMLTQYQRWICKKRRQPSVETLRKQIIVESEYQTVTHGTVYELQETNKQSGRRTYHVNTALGYCKICGKKHRVWQYDIFKNMSKQQRWEMVKIQELCFCCLEEGHKDVECSWGSTCNILGCLKKHNRMLHSANQEDELEHNPVRQSKISLMEGEEQQNTSFMATKCQKLGCISLQTVPIIVENGSKSLIINALLDDGSTQTYLNADIAGKLGLHGEIQKSQVSVINGKVATFETAPVEFALKSLKGAS